jgi:hypothetical protein
LRLARARHLRPNGKAEGAQAIVAESRGSDAYLLSQVYAALGEHDEAFRLLLFFLRESPSLGYTNTDPKFDSLRADPRWKDVLRQLKMLDGSSSH